MKHYPLVIADYTLGFSTEAFPLFALLSQNWAERVNIMHTKKIRPCTEQSVLSFLIFSFIRDNTNFMLRQSEAKWNTFSSHCFV